MRKLLLWACLALGLALPTAAQAQTPVSGAINAQATACPPPAALLTPACILLQVSSSVGYVSITVNGTFSQTLQFEWSPDGGNTWVSLSAIPNGGGSAVSSTTATGVWTAALTAATFVRVRGSSFSSGVALVTLTPGTGISLQAASLNQATTAAQYVSAYAGSSADVQMISAENLSFTGANIVVDLIGDQMLHAHPIRALAAGDAGNFQGSLNIPGPVRFWLDSADSIIVPSTVDINGGGQGLSTTPGNNNGTIFVACNSSGQITYAGCTQNMPNNAKTGVPTIFCHATCDETATYQAFESMISHIEIHCNMLANCWDYFNTAAQEDSGIMFAVIVGWGNGGRGIFTAYDAGGESANSTYTRLNMGNQGSSLSCTSSAVGIYITSGTTLGTGPKEVSDVTITNGGCGGASSPVINDCIIVAASRVHVYNVHTENCAQSSVHEEVGNASVTRSDHLEDINGTSTNAGSVVLIDNGSIRGLVIQNVSEFNATAPPYLITDNKNSIAIPSVVTSGSLVSVELYMTSNVNGSVIEDSSGTALSNYAGLIQTPGQFVLEAPLSISTSTTTDIGTIPFPQSSGTYGWHCEGMYQQAATLGTVNFAIEMTGNGTVTRYGASAIVYYNNTTFAYGSGQTSNLTAVGSYTSILGTAVSPAVAATPYWVSISGTVALPANTYANVMTLHVAGVNGSGSGALQLLRDTGCGLRE